MTTVDAREHFKLHPSSGEALVVCMVIEENYLLVYVQIGGYLTSPQRNW
jgi:hypothetical protein